MPNNLSAAAIGAEHGQFEPQRTNNWFIEIYLDALISQAASFGAGGFPTLAGMSNVDTLKLSLQAAFNPSSAKEDIQVPYLNEVIFFAGRRMVDPGSIELIDYVDKSTADIVYAWDTMTHDYVTGQVGLARNYKKRACIINFAPDGSFQRYWWLQGCWPQAVNYAGGGLNMASSEPVKIALTLRYDRFFRQSGAIAHVNVGVTVGGAAIFNIGG
jgi:hypothetical protein